MGPPGDHWDDSHPGKLAKGLSPGTAILPLNPWAHREPPSVSVFSEGEVGVHGGHGSCCSWSMEKSFVSLKPHEKIFLFIPPSLLHSLPPFLLFTSLLFPLPFILFFFLLDFSLFLYTYVIGLVSTGCSISHAG